MVLLAHPPPPAYARRPRSGRAHSGRKKAVFATSVMRFEWAGYEMNLLDTPGHNDFSEDTYRTLAATDSAIMLIDAV